MQTETLNSELPKCYLLTQPITKVKLDTLQMGWFSYDVITNEKQCRAYVLEVYSKYFDYK